ncbi:MAG: hypothetical protein IT428_33705 [Planctomycetaceae bacterium]|nr:hypothetical protein [Planctomycetaceae bacterium]
MLTSIPGKIDDGQCHLILTLRQTIVSLHNLREAVWLVMQYEERKRGIDIASLDDRDLNAADGFCPDTTE